MKSVFIAVIMLLVGPNGLASPSIKIMPIRVNIEEKDALQRGARFFMNYCSGCHALRYLRYSRMAMDLGLTSLSGKIDRDLLNNLMFRVEKIQNPIETSMPVGEAGRWFGRAPPDLSLSARERGAQWLYTYLHGFYVDAKRPFGTNNVLIPNVAMPNVLAPLQGTVMRYPLRKKGDHVSQLVLVEPGEMNAAQFDSMLRDIVTFLVYAAEPAQLIRYRLGTVIVLYLSVFVLVAFFLKKRYWQKMK